MTISPSRRTNLPVPAICVVLVVLVAGCAGIVGDSNESAVTVTPAAVPDYQSATPDAGASAISLTDGRFSDPEARADVHASILDKASYTVVINRTIRFVDDEIGGRWELTGRFAPDGRYRLDSTRNGSVFGTADSIRIAYWSDGRRVVEAYFRNDSATANVVRDSRGNPVAPRSVINFDPRFEDELARLFASTGITSITRLPRDGRPYERVSVTAVGRDDTTPLPPRAFGSSIRNLTVIMVIDERGVVRRYELEYEAEFADNQVVVTRSVRYEAVGATSVERPLWTTSITNRSGGSDHENSSGTNDSS